MIDTGIMNGADIVASVALGAKFTLIGRAHLYGLMAGGRQGVAAAIAAPDGRPGSRDDASVSHCPGSDSVRRVTVM